MFFFHVSDFTFYYLFTKQQKKKKKAILKQKLKFCLENTLGEILYLISWLDLYSWKDLIFLRT